MIKTSAMFSAHAIHVLIRNTLIFFIVLFIALFAWLSVGVEIDTFKASGYRVDGLYIKLDKKLTLKADKVVIPQRKENPSFDRIDETLESIKYLLTFFKHIDLKKIVFDNNILGIYFYDNILQLSSKDYLVRGNVHREGKMLVGDIPILQLKEHNITMRGTFTYDLHKDILTTHGKFALNHFIGDFEAKKIDNKVAFSIKSKPFSDLKTLIHRVKLLPAVRSWIVDKVKAKQYQILHFTGEGNIVNKHFQINLDSLKAKMILNDVDVAFKEGLPPVTTDRLEINYADNIGLSFRFANVEYEGRNLKGSSVKIVNLRDNNTTLKLNIQALTPIDEIIHTLLAAYHIYVPVTQKEGEVNATIRLDIGLKEKSFDSQVLIDLKQNTFMVGKIPFSVQSGNVSLKRDHVYLKDIEIKDKYYAGKLQGTIDLKNSVFKSIFYAKFITFKEQNKVLFDLKNKTIPFELLYKDTLAFKIPKYNVALTYTKKQTVLNMDKLSTLLPYVPDAIDVVENGNIVVKTKDFKRYRFKGVMQRKSCFLYENNNKCFSNIPFNGTLVNGKLSMYGFNGRVKYEKEKSRLTLKNINIDLEKFLSQETKGRANKNTKDKTIIIVGENSHLRYGVYQLYTDSYDVEVKKNGDISAIGSADGDIIRFNKKKELITLNALRIKDKILHPLIHFDGLQNGRYSLNKSGNPQKIMNGEIIVEGGVMKNFKAYNNTLAFINTLPALATLHNPGYSDEGFVIKSGVVQYRMIQSRKIVFDSIYIQGESATIVGKGEIDLVHQTINVELGIKVARTLGKVVGSIPLVGYILVGDDKSVTVGLHITGSLDAPKVSVSSANDLLAYPFKVIKRTIEAPVHLLAPN